MQAKENKKIKSGLLILIDGTSSAGKTSICNVLKPKLLDSVEHVTMDEFINQVFEQFKKNQFHESDLLDKCNYQVSLMYNHIKNLTNQDKTVICETTITCLEDCKGASKWFNILKNITGFLILIYCPFGVLVERVKARNKKALAENNPENTRLINVVLNQFSVMFKANENNKEPIIDCLNKEDCEFAFNLLRDEFTGDNKKLENFKIEIYKKLNLLDNSKIYISPRFAYDYIIDTAKNCPDVSADKIKNFLDLKTTPRAILKNCISAGIMIK